MLSVIPKHKGTEKMQADIKHRISKLKKTAPDGKTQRGKTFDPFLVEKAGGAQLAVIGPPNTGKSTLLHCLTNARPEIGAYPYTTRIPTPGMMLYEDVQIQLIDFPPIGFPEIEGNFGSALRRVNAALVVIDVQNERILEDFEVVLSALKNSKISLEKPPLPTSSWHPLQSLALANKCETELDQEVLGIFRDFYGKRFEILGCSFKTNPDHIEELRGKIFQLSNIIRVYSKPPGQPVDLSRPFVLRKGSSVYDLAKSIHKDIAGHLRGARVWGSGKFDGQMVPIEHVLADRDLVELIS
ncbi:MAG TPA: TGS domain-containing protein [Atribacteraceae bacterium]|nr:TGS domain-containing protein [Atribacteraceae bacterium]